MAHPTYTELLPILQASAKRWVPELIVDPENEPALRSILAWSCAHPTYEGDPGKGLLLIGHKGSGKTLLMRALGMCLSEELRFQVHNTRKVTSGYNTEGDAGIRSYTAPGNVLFDDLGDERMGQHYGDKVEVMSLIIQDRYELFVDRGIMTHFTTNLSASEIRERYGDRVYSRLKHMVNIIQVGAEVEAVDRRTNAPAPVRKVVEVIERIPASQEAAAEGLRKAREVIKASTPAFDVKPATVPPDRESDLLQFAALIMDKELPQLQELKARYALDPNSGPYIEIIDKAIAELNGVEA